MWAIGIVKLFRIIQIFVYVTRYTLWFSPAEKWKETKQNQLLNGNSSRTSTIVIIEGEWWKDKQIWISTTKHMLCMTLYSKICPHSFCENFRWKHFLPLERASLRKKNINVYTICSHISSVKTKYGWKPQGKNSLACRFVCTRTTIFGISFEFLRRI